MKQSPKRAFHIILSIVAVTILAWGIIAGPDLVMAAEALAQGFQGTFTSGARQTEDLPGGRLPSEVLISQSSPVTAVVSISSEGIQGWAPSRHPSISANGRYVAFESYAHNLVDNDTNGHSDVFVHDRDADEDGVFDEPGGVKTVLVSRTSDGSIGGNDSSEPSISADGRFVAFSSAACLDVLCPWEDNSIYVHDRDADENGIFDETEPGTFNTRIVTVSANGYDAAYGDSYEPSISSDGRFVAYHSFSRRLVEGLEGQPEFVRAFVTDRDQDGDGEFDDVLVNATRTCLPLDANHISTNASISDDGSVIGFSSSATNVGGPANGYTHIYRLVRGGSATAVTTSGDKGSSYPKVSADGAHIAFSSDATNLVEGDTNGKSDAFVYSGGSIRRVSISSNGEQANGPSYMPAVSSNGRYVTFESVADNLVPDDTNLNRDIFIHDRDADGNGVLDEPEGISTTRLSVSPDGANGNDQSSGISAVALKGKQVHIAYRSYASNLIAEDNNDTEDIFVSRITPALPGGPKISSIKSKQSKPGTGATILGSGFSATPSKNKVYFGKKRAVVKSARKTSLKVIIPDFKPGKRIVYVETGGKTSNAVKFVVK